MRHFRSVGRGPAAAQGAAPSIGDVFAFLGAILGVLGAAIVAKENVPPPQWPGGGEGEGES